MTRQPSNWATKQYSTASSIANTTPRIISIVIRNICMAGMRRGYPLCVRKIWLNLELPSIIIWEFHFEFTLRHHRESRQRHRVIVHAPIRPLSRNLKFCASSKERTESAPGIIMRAEFDARPGGSTTTSALKRMTIKFLTRVTANSPRQQHINLPNACTRISEANVHRFDRRHRSASLRTLPKVPLTWGSKADGF